MKRLLLLLLFIIPLFQINNSYAESIKKISHIQEIIPYLKSLDQDSLVIFDVDNTIFAPSDLIGRPKAVNVRRSIFKEYKKKYGKEKVARILSLYYLNTKEEFVEKEIKEIINQLYTQKIPTLALTAIGTKKFGYINNPMELRYSRLKEKDITFGFEYLNKKILWGNEAGYQSGIIFSGKETKGNALQYFLENIAHWKPKHIIFIDDHSKYLKSVSKMCDKLGIKFQGFHYKAAIFQQDQELTPEIARLQLKTLDEKEIWIPDLEAQKIIDSK